VNVDKIGSLLRATETAAHLLRKAGAKNCGLRPSEMDLITARLSGPDGVTGVLGWLVQHGDDLKAFIAKVEG
jgi:hypothetical protein